MCATAFGVCNHLRNRGCSVAQLPCSSQKNTPASTQALLEEFMMVTDALMEALAGFSQGIVFFVSMNVAKPHELHSDSQTEVDGMVSWKTAFPLEPARFCTLLEVHVALFMHSVFTCFHTPTPPEVSGSVWITFAPGSPWRSPGRPGLRSSETWTRGSSSCTLRKPMRNSTNTSRRQCRDVAETRRLVHRRFT